MRDERVQVIELDGDPVVTIQDGDLDGGLSGTGDVVAVESYQRSGRGGTFVYDLATDRFLHVRDGVSSYSMGRAGAGTPAQLEHPGERQEGRDQRLGELTGSAD